MSKETVEQLLRQMEAAAAVERSAENKRAKPMHANIRGGSATLVTKTYRTSDTPTPGHDAIRGDFYTATGQFLLEYVLKLDTTPTEDLVMLADGLGAVMSAMASLMANMSTQDGSPVREGFADQVRKDALRVWDKVQAALTPQGNA